MIKKTEAGLYFSTLDPKTFKTFSEAATHEEYTTITREASRPDSRDDIQKMTDEAFRVPMATKPSPLAMVAASLRKKTGDPAYKPGLSALESMELHIRSLTREQQDAADNAADAADWNQRHAAAKAEVSRLLEAAASDLTIPKGEVVALENLNRCLSTPGACEAHISSELRRLLGVEEARKLAIRVAANDELQAAQAKVAALQAVQTITTAARVPVAEGNLLQRGSSLIDSHMKAGSPFEVIDSLLKAQTEALSGNTSLMEAALQANEGGAA